MRREIHNFAVYILSNVFESIENNESKEELVTIPSEYKFT